VGPKRLSLIPLDKVEVGSVGKMTDIVAALEEATKVVSV
jgi:hypothetical protein